jgi:SNF2 family DNA or RNA helicase
MSNWKAEIERFAPSLAVFFVHPSETPQDELARLSDPETRQKQMDGKELVMTTYSLLQRHKWF